jgi:hypothetical protein
MNRKQPRPGATGGEAWIDIELQILLHVFVENSDADCVECSDIPSLNNYSVRPGASTQSLRSNQPTGRVAGFQTTDEREFSPVGGELLILASSRALYRSDRDCRRLWSL